MPQLLQQEKEDSWEARFAPPDCSLMGEPKPNWKHLGIVLFQIYNLGAVWLIQNFRLSSKG